jgi:hypothetical protein
MLVSPSKNRQIEDPKIPTIDGICGRIGANYVGRDSRKSACFRATYRTLVDVTGLENCAEEDSTIRSKNLTKKSMSFWLLRIYHQKYS